MEISIVQGDAQPFHGFNKVNYKPTDQKLSREGQCVVTVLEKNSIDDGLPKKIACKNIPITRSDGNNIRECEILKQCNHENILQLYFWEIIEINFNRSQFIVLYTELCDQNLNIFLKENKFIALFDLMALIMQLINGCQYLHNKNVVHRDIKPENILICLKDFPDSAIVKFADFGLSRIMPEHLSSLQFTACGTRDYCSPEMMQAMVKSTFLKENPFHTDIFSLGVVFYEMLTKKRPFSQNDLLKTMIKDQPREMIMQNLKLKVKDINANVSEGIDKMLQWKPENRPNANELKQYFQYGQNDALLNEIEETFNIFLQKVHSGLTTEDNNCLVKDFELYYNITKENIRHCTDYGQMIKIKFHYQSTFSIALIRLNEHARGVKQKGSRLESINSLKFIDACFQKSELQYKLVSEKISDPEDTAYLDLDQLRECVGKLQNKVMSGFRQYSTDIKRIKDQVEQAEDNSRDAQFQLQASTLSNEYLKSLEILKTDLEELANRFSATSHGKLARNVKKKCKIDKNNGLEIYLLPVVLKYKDDTHFFRHFSIGEEESHNRKPIKVIMMVGMAGAGKSLMINNIVNYVYGVNFLDNFRFKLILEDEDIKECSSSTDAITSKENSTTRWVSSYTLHFMKGFRVPFTLILIDTPGFGNSRDIDYDEKIITNMKEFFNNKTYPINELSCIGLVIQGNQPRLTAEQIYIFNAVLTIFGKDMSKNICAMLTFADAHSPPALESVNKQKIIIPPESMFKFNNSAVYAVGNNDDNAFFWKFGQNNLQKFFLHFGTIHPVSLTLTKEALKEREHLHFLLETLPKEITYGFETLKSLEEVTTEVIALNGTMKANKNFVVKNIVFQQETRAVRHDVANCQSCVYTCHDPCYEGYDKKTCLAMRNGKCVVCPGKCSWDHHSSGDRVYFYRNEVKETIQDMMDRYDISPYDKNAKLLLVQNLLAGYITQKNQVFDNIQQACRAAQTLEKIALGSSFLTTVAYIDMLIDSERRSDRPNKDNPLKQLEHYKKMAMLLENAQKDPNIGIDKMSKFEDTVMKAVMELEDKVMEEDFGILNKVIASFKSPFKY